MLGDIADSLLALAREHRQWMAPLVFLMGFAESIPLLSLFVPSTVLFLGIGAANRDPAEFADPDRLDVARHPNRHLAFGSGPHVCAGLNVARLEGRIAVGRFLARFPGYALAGTPLRGGRAREWRRDLAV